jgi:hypothetical protein
MQAYHGTTITCNHCHFPLSTGHLPNKPITTNYVLKSKPFIHIAHACIKWRCWLIISGFECKIGAKKIMCICGTFVIGTYVTILRFNLGEIVVNSSGHWFNENLFIG